MALAFLYVSYHLRVLIPRSQSGRSEPPSDGDCLLFGPAFLESSNT